MNVKRFVFPNSFRSCVRSSKCADGGDNEDTAEIFCEGPNMFIHQRRRKFTTLVEM